MRSNLNKRSSSKQHTKQNDTTPTGGRERTFQANGRHAKQLEQAKRAKNITPNKASINKRTTRKA
eukprot:1018731-Amphidinium_carterae.1